MRKYERTARPRKVHVRRIRCRIDLVRINISPDRLSVPPHSSQLAILQPHLD